MAENPSDSLRDRARRAKKAAEILRTSPGSARAHFLKNLSERLQARQKDLEEANQGDLAAARAAGLPDAVVDRLSLQGRVGDLVANTQAVLALPDPLGVVSDVKILASGLRVEHRRVPLGVLLLIYEARPNATIEASVLAIKSGNAILLKGGREAERSNLMLGTILSEALTAAGLPADAAQVLTPASHDETKALLEYSEYIDLVIPRGGQNLIDMVRRHARMPMLAHGPGICHVYIDADADNDMAVRIALDAKANRPATCNAAECLLVHPQKIEALIDFTRRFQALGGEVRGCPRTQEALASRGLTCKTVTESDFSSEYLGLIINVRVVDTFAMAVEHIARYGTRHSEAIVTNSLSRAEQFCRQVDASCVLVNASTRLNDGYALGLGAELGISTTKFHAYGPMGLSALTIEKTVAVGDGQTRS